MLPLYTVYPTSLSTRLLVHFSLFSYYYYLTLTDLFTDVSQRYFHDLCTSRTITNLDRVMALISLAALVAAVGVFLIARYIENVRKNRLPAGVQKLPGPKGEHLTEARQP